MKRSEMEYKIEEYLLQHEGGVKIHVRRLLTLLEKEGMLPPAYEKFVEIDYRLGLIDEKLYCKRPINDWEPEDKA